MGVAHPYTICLGQQSSLSGKGYKGIQRQQEETQEGSLKAVPLNLLAKMECRMGMYMRKEKKKKPRNGSRREADRNTTGKTDIHQY